MAFQMEEHRRENLARKTAWQERACRIEVDEAVKSSWVKVCFFPILWFPSRELQTSCPATFLCLSYTSGFQGDKVKIRLNGKRKTLCAEKCPFLKNLCIINTCATDRSTTGVAFPPLSMEVLRVDLSIYLSWISACLGAWKGTGKVPMQLQASGLPAASVKGGEASE